ncbi:MAG: hypothetical protein U9O94_07690 [Nanoarchaeota archaeon]|nr:hypothetical protein [Nanoarchaeota archaeon]
MPSKKLAYHILFILLIITIGYYNIREFWVYNEMQVADTSGGYYPRAQTLKESVFKYGDFFPLWQPYLMSGEPYLDGTSTDIISYLGFFTLIFPNAFMATGLTYIISYILCGISMYFLGLYLFRNPKYAFLSAIILMLSGYTTSRFLEGTHQLSALSLLPLAFLFLMKAFKEKDWLKNTVICGVFIALQIKVAPDMKVTLFTTLLFGLYLVFQVIGKNVGVRVVKVSLVSILLLTVIFGLTAHYILPQKEVIDKSARGHNPWEKSSGRKTEVKALFSTMVEPFHKNIFRIRPVREGPGIRYKIGIIAFLLVGFAIYKKAKNKFILFLIATVLLSISIATASFVFYLLWRYIPPWDSFRYVSRAYVLWSFAGAILAGFGAKYLIETLKKKFKLDNKKLNIALAIIIILVIANLVIFTREPVKGMQRCDLYSLLENADALQYIKQVKDENNEIFRVHDWETTGIDWPTDPYTVALGLEHIFGYLGGWDVEYMNVYLSLAYRNPAKFWGNLNVKYLTSRSNLSLPNFKLVNEFERFESDGECPPFNQSTWNDPHADAGMKAFGEFLYENEMYLPRAYLVDNSILIVGKHENVMNLMYGLMLDGNYNPENTVIIRGRESINDYSMEELGRYSAIFLTEGSIDANSNLKLSSYVNGEGILMPDVVNGKNQILPDDINKMWQSFTGSLNPIPDKDVITESFEKKIIRINEPSNKFLVLSERYSMYNGWEAKVNGKKLEILRANGVISTVYLGGNSGELRFRFMPKSYRNGVIITLITIILLGAYFGYGLFRRLTKSRK